MALNSLTIEEIDVPITESWAYTHIKNEKFSFTWIIENFSLLNEETGKLLESPEFTVGANGEHKWNLEIYPRGSSIEYKEFLSVFLTLRSSYKSTAICKFKFSILNAEKVQTYSESVAVNTFDIDKCKNLGLPNFINRAFLLKESNCFLPKDTLTIVCEGSIVTDRINTFGQGNPSKNTVPEPDCKFSEDFKNVIVDENFSDVILEVGGHELKAHKAILASQSEVLAAMFKHNLEEKISNRVTITGIDHEVLKEILRFIYTGTALNLEKIAMDLYAAADKYGLEKLKVICEKFLLENLSAETAAETLILSNLYSAVQMKADTINFIKSNIMDITKTKGWLNMLTSYPNLLAEIIQ